MRKIKFGLIGCGKITQSHHIPELLSISDKAEITALYDIKKSSAMKANEENNINAKYYSNLKNLLTSDIDAIIISTPNIFHYPQTIAALNAGKHVLVEKPIADTIGHAEKMIAKAKEKKLILQVNQSLRFNNIYTTIKKIIDKGQIGEVIHMRCLRTSDSSPNNNWSAGADWFVKKNYCGGLIMDIAVHMADILGWYGGKIKKVHSIAYSRVQGIDVPDNVNALFEFENKATAVLELSWTIPFGAGLLEIYGTKGTIRLGFTENLEIKNNDGDFQTVEPENCINSHQTFINSIEKGKNIADPEIIGKQALMLCLAIKKAGKSNKAVEINW